MNTTHIKFESDALVCMLCFAAFIGYALGVQYAANATKTQECNKVHKVTQTNLNLSELAEILTSNRMMIDGGGKHVHVQRDSNATVDNVDEKREENHSLVESRMEEDKCKNECQGMKSHENSNPNEILSENVVSNNFGNINNSEEEYEVVIGNIKKLDTKKQHYYFGWFDSVF
jgi:hypothetical protein